MKREQHINVDGEVSDTAELYRSFLPPLIQAVNEDGTPLRRQMHLSFSHKCEPKAISNRYMNLYPKCAPPALRKSIKLTKKLATLPFTMLQKLSILITNGVRRVRFNSILLERPTPHTHDVV